MSPENTELAIDEHGEYSPQDLDQLGDGLNLEETYRTAQKVRFFTRTALGGIKIRPKNKRRSTRVVL